MNLNQLKYVISIAENGSFSSAAKELYITQPSLSNQIKALEEEIGTPLFIRMHHSLKLTEAGHDFVLYSRRIMNELDNLQNLMQSYSSYSRGRLNIGIFSNAGYLGTAENIMTFQKLYPRINIKIVMEQSQKLIDLLMTQEIDVAVLTASEASIKSSDFQYVQLAEDPLVVIIPKKHSLSNRTSLQMKDIKNEKFILPQNSSYIYSAFEDKFLGEEVEFDICGRSNTLEGCVQMVCSGFGISVIPASAAKKLKNISYTSIPLASPVYLKIYLAMLKTSYPGSISDEFFNFLQTQFR